MSSALIVLAVFLLVAVAMGFRRRWLRAEGLLDGALRDVRVGQCIIANREHDLGAALTRATNAEAIAKRYEDEAAEDRAVSDRIAAKVMRAIKVTPSAIAIYLPDVVTDGEAATELSGKHFLKGTAAERRAAGSPSGYWTSQDDGVKGFTPNGEPLGKNTLGRKHGSKSKARKMASAKIAKIPFPLSSHIARVYYPRDRGAVALSPSAVENPE